jgi:hypothetical protein
MNLINHFTEICFPHSFIHSFILSFIPQTLLGQYYTKVLLWITAEEKEREIESDNCFEEKLRETERARDSRKEIPA